MELPFPCLSKTSIPQHPVHQHKPSAGVQKELALLVLVGLTRQEPGGDVLENLLQWADHPRCQGFKKPKEIIEQGGDDSIKDDLDSGGKKDEGDVKVIFVSFPLKLGLMSSSET